MTERQKLDSSPTLADTPTRRRVLCQIAGCGCAAALASLNGCTVAEVYGSLADRTVLFDLAQSQYAALKDVGGMVALDEEGWRIVLVRRTMDEVIALDRICPHEECDMAPNINGFWNGQGDVLICTCHGSTFSAEGKVDPDGPAVDDIASFEVRWDPNAGTGAVTLALPNAAEPTSE